MERHLQKLNWPSVRELVPEQIETVVLPVGTVEAHGSACIGTDNLIPETIADGIAERINGLIAPTVSYGVTKSLRRYPGSSWVKPLTLQLYVREVLDSFADTGFRNVILLNGHGGNNSALKAVALDFHHEKHRNIVVIHWWELCGEMTREFFGQHGGHAGTDEVAMILALDPDLGGQDTYDPAQAYTFRSGADVYPVPGSILLYKENEGYPSFDIEKAREFRQRVITEVGDFIETVISRWRELGF